MCVDDDKQCQLQYFLLHIPFDFIILNLFFHKKPSFLCYFLRASMGYYYVHKARPCDARTPNVVLILVLALILLAAPKLFSGEPEEEEETNYTSPFVALILLVLILLLLSLFGTSRRKVSFKPPYCQCTYACYCYR